MLIDLEFVRRVEHSAAELGVRQARALAASSPSSGAAAERCDGGALIAFGPGRYVNRAIGLGLGDTPASELVAAIDRFYDERSMPPSLEINPFVTEELLATLTGAGYRLDRFRNVYAHDLGAVPDEGSALLALLDAGTAGERKRILADGAASGTHARQISDEFCDALATMDDTYDLVAFVDGTPAACGSLTVVDGVGWLGGAATDAAQRGRGLQSALVANRLRRAADERCTLAAATALPGGHSAHNLVRLGFELLYTQAVMTRP